MYVNQSLAHGARCFQTSPNQMMSAIVWYRCNPTSMAAPILAHHLDERAQSCQAELRYEQYQSPKGPLGQH